MNTPPTVALGDELARIIDGLTVENRPMHSSARDCLLLLCTAADRIRATESVSMREESLLASELELHGDLEQLAAQIQHPIWIEKGRIHVSPHRMPETQEQEAAA